MPNHRDARKPKLPKGGSYAPDNAYHVQDVYCLHLSLCYSSSFQGNALVCRLTRSHCRLTVNAYCSDPATVDDCTGNIISNTTSRASSSTRRDRPEVDLIAMRKLNTKIGEDHEAIERHLHGPPCLICCFSHGFHSAAVVACRLTRADVYPARATKFCFCACLGQMRVTGSHQGQWQVAT